MEPVETQVIAPTGNKQSYAKLLTTIDDEHLILHLRHVVEIWFKDNDILAWEEFVRRFTKQRETINEGDAMICDLRTRIDREENLP